MNKIPHTKLTRTHVKQAENGEERFIITLDGSKGAALVSLEDLQTLEEVEAIEDRLDAEAVEQATVPSGVFGDFCVAIGGGQFTVDKITNGIRSVSCQCVPVYVGHDGSSFYVKIGSSGTVATRVCFI